MDPLNGACTSLVIALRNEIVTFVNSSFPNKSDTRKIEDLVSLIHLERIILEWFSHDQLHALGVPTMEDASPAAQVLAPTMRLIAELVEAREKERQNIRAKKKESLGKISLGPAEKLPIGGQGAEFPLWDFYAELMNELAAAAVVAQDEFLRQLRACLLANVKGFGLEEKLVAALRSKAPAKGSTLLVTDPFDNVPLVRGVTKGGDLIFSSTEGELVDELIRKLSTYRL